MRHDRQHGFTLIELLVSVAIIGIVAAIAMMSYMSAMTRARQKRTATDIRAIAQAWEARAADTQSYSIAGIGYSFPGGPVSTEDIVLALQPTYIRNLPQRDGWGNPFGFAAEPDSNQYAIRSAGRDGAFENGYTPGETTSPDCDIVYASGSFVCYPATVQTK